MSGTEAMAATRERVSVAVRIVAILSEGHGGLVVYAGVEEFGFSKTSRTTYASRPIVMEYSKSAFIHGGH